MAVTGGEETSKNPLKLAIQPTASDILRFYINIYTCECFHRRGPV